MKFRMAAVGIALMVLLAGCGSPGPGANETSPGDEESPGGIGVDSPTETDDLMGTETTEGNETTTDGEFGNETTTDGEFGNETTTDGGV